MSLNVTSTTTDTSSNAAIRRRMNPDSLAGRLGPDLVKELEDLLKSGMTEMPSFAVRQEIQQRYGIDRRHIYDWFHNKGLRVTTSEKREERRAMRAREHARMPTTRNQAQERNRVYAVAEPLLSSSSMPNLRHASPDSKPSTPILSASSVAGFTGGPLSYEAACAMGPNLGYSLVPPNEYADMLLGTPPMDFATEPFSTSASQVSAIPDRVNEADSADTLSKAYTDRTFHWIAEQQKIPYSPLVDGTIPLPSSGREELEILDAVLPFDHEKVLPQHQREACYRSLSEALPPARGIEECVGTYKAFMSQQGRKYYERLVSGYSHSPRYQSAAHTPVASSLLSSGVPSSNVSAPASLCGRNSVPSTQTLGSGIGYSASQAGLAPSTGAPSPSETPALSESATTVASSAPWSHGGCGEHQRERSAASCIDIAEILESPVLRSRHPTQASLTHASPRYGPAAGDPAMPASYSIDAIGTPVSFTYAPPTVCYDYNRGHHYPGSFPGSAASCVISAPFRLHTSQGKK
ncbi:DNA translocase FtsK-like protein [Phanerochaete sordida]|uniref:DNA translocase FtsK-like protein n=1 Tax=Phanerochaete sordida TaxID=48140 RepID=A0A9P3G121_9APHY|nr:DNA translocase FtsK-like protein [Phanerochaete sordida]